MKKISVTVIFLDIVNQFIALLKQNKDLQNEK